MSYTINKFSGPELIVLEDGTLDTSTSLGLVGKNYVGYGETQNENFVFLLENFSNNAPPSRPIQGQTWFNSSNSLLYVYTGTNWAIVGAAILAATAPEEPANGALWLDSDLGTLNIWNGTAWDFIGPEIAEGFGVTRARSTTLLGTDGNRHPVILLTIDNVVTSICSSSAFTIALSESVDGFLELAAGITISSLRTFKGDIIGNSSSASRLETLRTINGIGFNGTTDIIVQATTTNSLVRGDYLNGSNFNGSTPVTWSVDASSANIIGKVVVRNSQGGFAAGTITADLVGNVTGNVTATTGTSVFNTIQATEVIGPVLRGNSSSATRLQTGRNINGTYFDGSADVTVTAAAGTLTGTTLNGSVTTSSLTSVGTLTSLKTLAAGVEVDGSVKLFTDTGSIPTLISLSSNKKLKFKLVDTRRPGSSTNIDFIPSSDSLALGGIDAPALIPETGGSTNLGHPTATWNKLYASNLVGNADTATLAATATNIAGGAAGSLPYQNAIGTTSLLPLGVAGHVLTAGTAGTLSWKAIGQEVLSPGTHLSFTNTSSGSPLASYDLNSPTTISINATASNSVSTVVSRDNSGNFSAATITATLSGNVTGNVTGNSTTSTRLQTARTINGVLFDGSANITVLAPDATKVPLAGGTMTGYLTLVGAPVSTNHATTKAYVDSRLPVYTFTSGAQYTYGYTNIVGSWNNDYNWVDVYPPYGRTMGNLVAFIPSIHAMHFAGGVNGDDSIRCSYSYLADRIRIYVQNTEQRSTPAANWLAVWS